MTVTGDRAILWRNATEPELLVTDKSSEARAIIASSMIVGEDAIYNGKAMPYLLRPLP